MNLVKHFILLNILIIISCNHKSSKNVKLDFEHAIGKYQSKYKGGKEWLELKSDSTFIYHLKQFKSNEFQCTGKWLFKNIKNNSWKEAEIHFKDWPIGIDPETNRTDLINKIMDNNEKNTLTMDFLIESKLFNNVFVLRRNYDLQEEFDFNLISN